jgi:hypothetical protein
MLIERKMLFITDAKLIVLSNGTTSATWKDEGRMVASATYNTTTGRWVSCWIESTHRHNIPDQLFQVA